MKDKLTKKRVKVDYLLVIAYEGLSNDFLLYQKSKRRHINVNRLAYTYCLHKKIDVQSVVACLNQMNIHSIDELESELIRIAKIPWLED